MVHIIRDSSELQVKIDCYSVMLFKIAYLRLQNVQDAEDVVQEVFYQYIRHEEAFLSEEHEKAWLIKVTLNACRKLWRSAWHRHRGGDIEDMNKYGSDNADNLIQGKAARNLEEEILKVEKGRLILQAVKALPVKYRDVIHLFYYEDMCVKEIAKVTGRKESTVTSQLTRARELLRKSLKEDYDFA